MLKKSDKMDAAVQKARLIPSGELKCVWMTAGVVSYKLCNHGYECETCPFDQSMRREDRQRAESIEPGDDAVYQSISPDSLPCLEDPENMPDARFETLFRELRGIRIRKNYLYHRGHTWAEVSDHRPVRIGIDEFAGKCLPDVRSIIFPARNNRVDQGQACCWIATEDGTLPILAPLTGTMVATNPELVQQQNLVRKAPYEHGWLMDIEPEDLHRDLIHLYDDEKACRVCQKDFRKLTETFMAVLNVHGDRLGPTLHDGGTAFTHLREAVGPRRYFEIITPFLSTQGK